MNGPRSQRCLAPHPHVRDVVHGTGFFLRCLLRPPPATPWGPAIWSSGTIARRARALPLGWRSPGWRCKTVEAIMREQYVADTRRIDAAGTEPQPVPVPLTGAERELWAATYADWD